MGCYFLFYLSRYILLFRDTFHWIWQIKMRTFYVVLHACYRYSLYDWSARTVKISFQRGEKLRVKIFLFVSSRSGKTWWTFNRHVSQKSHECQSTLDPAYRKFGYNQHPAIMSKFLCIKIIDSNVETFGLQWAFSFGFLCPL